jgi:cytochrome c-type biogenesis protein CcmH/NrfF
VQDILSNATSFAMATSSMLAVLASFQVNIPKPAVVVIIVLIFALPVTAIVVGVIVTMIRERRAKKVCK